MKDIDQPKLKLLAIKLEEKRGMLMVNADISRLQEMISTNLYYGHSGGYFGTKDSFIEKLADGIYDYHN